MLYFLFKLCVLFLSSIGFMGCSKKPTSLPPSVKFEVLKNEDSLFSPKDPNLDLHITDRVKFDLANLLKVSVSSQCVPSDNLQTLNHYSVEFKSSEIPVFGFLHPQVLIDVLKNKSWRCDIQFNVHHVDQSISTVLLRKKSILMSAVEFEDVLFENNSPLQISVLPENTFKNIFLNTLEKEDSAELICETFSATLIKDTHSPTSLHDLASHSHVTAYKPGLLDPRHSNPSQECALRIKKQRFQHLSKVFALKFIPPQPQLDCKQNFVKEYLASAGERPLITLNLKNPYDIPLTVALLKQNSQLVNVKYTKSTSKEGNDISINENRTFTTAAATSKENSKSFDGYTYLWIAPKQSVRATYNVNLNYFRSALYETHSPTHLCSYLLLNESFETFEEVKATKIYRP